MRSLMRNLLSVVAVFAVSWAGAIYYWRSSGVSPSGRDLLVYLGAVPVSLSSLGWYGRSLLQRLVDARAARRDAATDAANAKATDATADGGPLAASASVGIVATALNLPVGADAAQLLAQPQESWPRPALHPDFRDHDGLPLFAVWVPELDTETELQAWGGENAAALSTEAQRRAVALLAPVLSELLSQAQQALPAAVIEPERVVAGLRRKAESVVQGFVQVHLLVPADWSPAARTALADWAGSHAVSAGLPQQAFSVQVLAAAGSGEVWECLRGLIEAPAAPSQLHLLLATASLLDPRRIERMLGEGVLMTRDNPDGVQPGEGAAGLLLRPGTVEDGDLARLYLPLRAEIPETANARVRARQTAELLEQSLASARIEDGAVGWVVSDASPRGGRTAEAAMAATTACGDLDTSTQFLALGSVCGSLPPVEPLLMLALAASKSADKGSATVILDAGERDARRCAVLAPSPSLPHDSGENRQALAAALPENGTES